MKSLRQAISKSSIPAMRVVRADLALSLGLRQPLSLTDLTRFFEQPETRHLSANLDADALHGATEFIMRSDGTYTFRGHLNATGFPSFAFRVQASVHCAAGIVIVVETRGRVFGSDTPGPDHREWNEDGASDAIRTFWPALRLDPKLATDLEKNLSGITGALVDVALTVVKTYVAAQFSGIVGAVIVLGGELGAATGVTFSNPKLLAGVTVASGVLLVFGPGAIIPALAAGSAVALLAGVQFRPMNDAEIALAFQVFKGTLPVERILITNLYNPTNTDNGFLAREFTMPGIADGKILVNMGENFEHTLEPDVQQNVRGAAYQAGGQVLIHELMHAWQIHHATFLPGLLCQALTSANYKYDEAKVNQHASWSQSFDLEGQAAIIDKWFGANRNALDSFSSFNDPRFFYVSQHIRTGRT
ncbi:MAG: hypothetical protein IPP47_17825 [Bryobacterales bacterium]|nr:hypothetical protein [Bryobacterales bacterium]